MTDGSKISSTSSKRVCHECQSPIFADAPQGLCSVCIFKTMLGLLEIEHQEGRPESTLRSMPVEFDDYELLNEIGRGGQAVVYRARQKSLNRTVALKVIGLGRWETESHLKRFRFEAEAAARLNHPSIVPIHEIGERDDCCYYSMNLIEGGQLDEVVRRDGMPIRRAAEMIAQLARTVHYAHEHGILHRDIKPGNVLLDAEGQPHLTDFGLARLLETERNITRTTEMVGTPSYMAPEQASGNNATLTSAADVYGLGAVFYQLLTGNPPFVGETTYETVRLVLETDARPPRLLNPKVDRELSTICLKCLEKDPERRYGSALALAEDLERWLRDEPIQARPAGFFVRGKKWLQRNPAIAVAAGSLAALLAIVGVLVWKNELVRPPPIVSGVAILPFENLSEDKANAYFVEGIQDEILTSLSSVRDLKVISGTSTTKYKSKPDNLPEIARHLGVANFVEGSVQKASERAHINVQLIDAHTGAQLWAQSYDRDLKNIFAVENEVAEEIATALKLKFPSSASNAERDTSADPQAYDLFLQGRYAWREWFRGNCTVEEPLRLFRAAIARDPKFARAYGWLSIVEAQRLDFMTARDPALGRDARLNAKKALSLQPGLTDGECAMGMVYLRVDHDYNKALDYFTRVREKEPGAIIILIPTAIAQSALGRWDEAVDTIQQAANLSPDSSRCFQLLGQFAATTRQYSRAHAAYDRSLVLDPNDWNCVGANAMAFLMEGKVKDARDFLSRLPKDTAFFVSMFRWKAAFFSRDYAGALQLAQELPKGEAGEKELFIAQSLIALGDRAAGMRSLDDAWAKTNALLPTHPDSVQLHQLAAQILAARGEKNAAIAEAEQAMSIQPVSKNALNGLDPMEVQAEVYANFGDLEHALPILQRLLTSKGGGLTLSPATMRLDPAWDPIRNTPAFQRLIAEGDLINHS